jgi:chemotaxis protein CheX
MNVAASAVQNIVENIWGSVLGMPVSSAAPGQALPGDESMTVCVSITGKQAGALVLSCSITLARKMAAVMFAIDAAAVQESDMRDALGEVVNIAGGNLKSLLPPGSDLSLPTVIRGERSRVFVGRTRLASRHLFVSEGETVLLEILEQERAG